MSRHGDLLADDLPSPDSDDPDGALCRAIELAQERREAVLLADTSGLWRVHSDGHVDTLAEVAPA
jgi:hypothetical protein